MTNNKLCHRVLALVMAGILCASALPVPALAEDESGNLSAVTLPLDRDTVDVGSATPETGVKQEESCEEQTEDQDEEPLPEPSADAATSEDTVPLPEMPEVPSAAEKCAAYAHLSDAGGVCTVCGTDLKAEFTALYNAIDSASFSAKMNAWGWYEQHLDAQDAASVAAYEQAEAEGQTAYAALQDARDVFDCLELAVEELPEELYAMLLDLYAIWQSGQAAYQYPQDPAVFVQANGTDGLTDDILWGDLPDAPTGSYIGSRGLPVATGETKIGISAWTTQLYGGGGSYLDATALNSDGLTVQVAREPGKSYAVVPIMVQVEYPENDSSSYISLPEGVEVLRYHSDAEPASDSERDSILYDTYLETAAAASGFFVRADADFTAAFTYVDAAGNATTKTLRVVVSDSADAALQTLGGGAGGAATLADRPTPTVTSGVITKIQYVVDTWLIWFNGQEAYCCSHGLQGKVEGCPTYSYAYTSILAPGQYTGDHYTTQVSVWGGLGQLSVGTLTEQHSDAYSESAFYPLAASTSLAEEALLEACYRYYDDVQMYIIIHYPESEAAQIYLASAQAVMSGAETLASDTGYYTYIYTPPISGWQTIAVIGPPTDEDAEEPVTSEYYADWSAPPQTASGEFTFDYRIQVDKYQLGTNAAGQYTDWVYKNQFSSVSRSKALDGTKTYDGYSVSYAEGYLCDEQNHYITLTYETEGWYVEKTTFEDNRQPTGEEIDSTRYGASYHLHRSNDLAESQDQVMKANVQISKVVSSTGQSNGLDLEGAGFTFFLISDLSKADQFTVSNSGLYQLDSILAEYTNPAYNEDTPKYDFSGEAQAIAKTYEVAASEIEAYNWTLTAAGDYRNGSGNGWVSTGRPNEYQLSEIFSNDTGTLRVEGLPYGQYLCVETTTPKDVFQAQPFLVVVSPSDRKVPQSGMATPNAYAVPGSDSFLRYTILDEKIEAYLRITKIDDETGKPVLLADTAYQIYWLDEDGNYCLDSNGNPRRVVMTNTANGSLAKEVDTFYTTAEGVLTLPEKLPLGKYRIVELDGPNGFHNAWASAQQGAVDFEVTTDQAYQATGDKNENGQDTLVIQVDYHNNETLGVLTIRKTGEVLTGFENGSFLYEERPLAGAEYTITAAEDIYTQDRQQAADGSRTLWYAKGDVVAVVTTGGGETDTVRYAPARTPAAYEFLSVIHDGTVGEVRVTLPLGSYHVEETKPPYGMVGTAQSYDVTFTWDAQTNDVVLASTIVNTPEDGEAVTSCLEVVSLQDASQDLVEQQVLAFRNKREKARVGVYKTDAETGAYLAGAVFDLYTREDLYDADGNLLLKAGEWVATSPETAADGTTDFTCDLPIRGELYGKSDAKTAATNSGTYMIVESRAPQGYYLNAEPMEVSFTYDGQAVQVLESTCGNQPTEIWVSKRDLTNGEELPGASLSITDSEGNTVREWVSDSQPERITALHLEESYTMTETRPADGYALADSITFRLVQRKDDTGKLMQECDVYYLTTGRFLFWSWEDWTLLDDATVILCDDTIKVQISKKDLTNQEELPGAHLTLTDAEGNVVDDWVSGTEPHYLEKLPAGQYTLTENTAPEGYAVAESVPIVVLPTGEIQSFEMLDDTIKVQISKQDITSKEELPGAHLTLTDAEGNVVDDWVSGTEPHYLEKLPAGQYTLTEVSAPAGYKVAESIVFTVAATGEVQHVTMYDEHEPAPTPAPTPTPAPGETPAPTPTPQARIPQTGDPANLALWVGLLAASLLGLAIGLAVAIRRRKNGKLPALPAQEELVPDDARREDPDQ